MNQQRVPDERLNQLANDPMMCNISTEVRSILQEAIELRSRVEQLKRAVGDINPLTVEATDPAERLVNRLYYHQKDGGCKHDWHCGKICYMCVEKVVKELQAAEEVARRTCNENYAWAKRLETKIQELSGQAKA